jgi:hypothetical protein
MLLGYIIPEFPGQTHVWMWREIVHMWESGAEITIFSTRRPSKRDRARHAFADRGEDIAGEAGKPAEQKLYQSSD